MVFARATDEAPRVTLQRAYRWIVERAIVCESPDLVLGAPPLSRRSATPRGDAYASYVLLPLLALVTRQRTLIVGAPGRGKTTLATLMALLAGGKLADVRRFTQHGHPQLTIADLLGSPLPGNLVEAKSEDAIRVAWRPWLRAPVKIVDEYNRIPTKTQSALLSLMAEGYAEQFGQVIECGQSAWFLTANDDLGGGTFQVIDALRDRIDVVVRAAPFEGGQMELLARRVAEGRAPEDEVPADCVLGAEPLARAEAEVRAVALEDAALQALATFASQVEFCGRASDQLAYMTKDTLRVAGRRLAQVCTEECPLDKREHACAQTEAGLSTRAHLAAMRLAQALAWFRGRRSAGLQELRAVLPFVLHDRLRPHLGGEFFLDADGTLASDRVAWITQLFDRTRSVALARAERRRELAELAARAPRDRSEARALRRDLEGRLDHLLARDEMSGAVREEALQLEALHRRWAALAEER